MKKWNEILVWRIELTETAAKRLKKIDRTEAKRITGFLRERPAALDDHRSLGEALRGPSMRAYWRYCVGDYRIICDIRDRIMRVMVITPRGIG